MSRESRIKLIGEIEKKRNSKVITYITSDRPRLSSGIAGDIVSIIHEHILGFDPSERKKIDLFIYSRGGNSDVPWSLVSMFREYCEEGSFSVLIPYRAHSAATVISLGADEIVMTKKAELGPIDITLQDSPYNPKDEDSKQRLPVSVEDVMGYFALLEKIKCNRIEDKMKGFEQISSKVHPLVIGNVNRLLEQTQLVALRLLGTRAKPFPEKHNKDIIKRLSSEIYSHQHTISRSEAINNLGLNQVIKAEDVSLDESLWNLFIEYRDLFLFEDPFKPEEFLVSNKLDEKVWEKLNLACVESTNRFDVCRKDVRVKRLRQIPPQVTLNLNNLPFPTINIPNLPEGVSIKQLLEQMLPAIVKPIIDDSVSKCIQDLIKNLPYGQFEIMDYNAGWNMVEE